MSKNLTKTNNTIKKVIARLCKCFAIFAVFLFVGVFANAQKVGAGCDSNVQSYKGASGGTYSSGVFSITSESSSYVSFNFNTKSGVYYHIYVYVDGTQVLDKGSEYVAAWNMYCDNYPRVYFGTGISSKSIGYLDKDGYYYTDIKLPYSLAKHGSTIKIELSRNIGGSHSISFTVKDAKGPSAPTVNNPNNNKWAKPGYTISWSGSTDSYSGFSKYQYRNDISGDAWKDLPASGSDTWTAERNNKVCFRGVDKAGNGGSETCTTVKIDNTKPILDVKPPASTEGSISGSTYYAKKNVNMTVELKTAGSFESLTSTSSIKYKWCTSSSSCSTSYSSVSRSNYVATIKTPNSDGTYYLWLEVASLKDDAGNTANAEGSEFSKPTGAYAYKFVVSNAVPTWRVELYGKIETNLNRNTVVENSEYYTKDANASSYMLVIFEGENLVALSSTACNSITVSGGTLTITRENDTTCKLKLQNTNEAIYNVSVGAVIKNQSNISNGTGSYKLVVDRTAPKITSTITDTTSGLTSCSSNTTFCYQPKIEMKIDDANAVGGNLVVQLYAASPSKQMKTKTVTFSTTKGTVFESTDFVVGQYNLSTTYLVKVQKFADKAGNYLCSDSYCSVLSNLYISNVAPTVQVTYVVGGKNTTTTAAANETITIPANATNVKFADKTGGYGIVKVDANIALLRGNKATIGGVTNRSDTFNNNYMSTATGRSDGSAVEFSRISGKSSGYTFVAKVDVKGAWSNASTTIPSTMSTTVYIAYDSFAPLFKQDIIADGNTMQTSTQAYNTTSQKYDIYINASKSTIDGALMDSSKGYNSSTDTTFGSLKNKITITHTFKIGTTEVPSNTKVIKSVSGSQTNGEVEITVTGSNGVSSKCTIYYDCRGVSLDLLLINTENGNNIYLEEAAGVYQYYYILSGKFKLTITNSGSREISEPVLTATGKESMTCQADGDKLSHVAGAANHSCDLIFEDETYINTVLTITATNDYNVSGTVKIKINKITKSFDGFVTNTVKPTFTIGSLTLTSDYISGSGNAKAGTLAYEMYLDYDSFLLKSKTATISAAITKPGSSKWKDLNSSAHLTSSATIGSTITGQYYSETVTVSHKLVGSNMLGCIIDGEEVNCNESGTLDYTLVIYYLKNNLEYIGPESISLRNDYSGNLTSFAYKNGDCSDETTFCTNLKDGIVATNMVSLYDKVQITIASSSVGIKKLTGFIEGRYSVRFTLSLNNASYKIQTTEARRTITIEQEIFFYTSDLTFTPVIKDGASLKWFDMISESNIYYTSITNTSSRIYFSVISSLSKINSVNMVDGKEISFTDGTNTYTSADPFGVEGSYVYIQLTSDMLTAISDGTQFTITLPAKSFKLNNQIENANTITFTFKNDISPSELPYSVNESYSDGTSTLPKVKVEHQSYTGGDFNHLVLGTNETYAVTFGDTLKVTLAIKESSPLIVLSGTHTYNVCTSTRKDLTADKILLGNKAFSTCVPAKVNGYLVLTLTYDVNKTWNGEVKDIAVSSLIYDAAFNQIAYKSIGLGAVIKVLPNAEIESIVEFEKATVYKNPDTLVNTNYLNYSNTMVVKMAASDHTLFNYDKLAFVDGTTTYTLTFYNGNTAALTINSGVTFESDAVNRKVKINFNGSGANGVDFDSVSINIVNFFYDGAKMSTVLTKEPMTMTHKFVTNAVIALDGVSATAETLYMNEDSKDNYSYINTYTGFNKDDTYLYYTSGEDKLPLASVCDVKLNSTYGNDIAYRISECRGNVNLSNVGMHVKDKIDYEKDVSLNLTIVVDNTAPTIGDYTLSKDDSSYQSDTLYYILTAGNTYYAYYLITLNDASSQFDTNSTCSVAIESNSKLLGRNPECDVISATQAKVKLTFDTSVSAKSLRNEMSFIITTYDRAGNGVTETLDAKINAVYDTSIAETFMYYRLANNTTTCAINAANAYCEATNNLVLRAHFEESVYARYLASGSKFHVTYQYKDSDGALETETIESTSFVVDADDYITITFANLPTIKAPYATATITGALKDLANKDMYVTYLNENNENIYLFGDAAALFNSTSPYYIVESDEPTCVVQDANCDVASQIASTKTLEELDKYGFEYNGIFDASTKTVENHDFTFTVTHTYIEPTKSASKGFTVKVTEKTIYLSFKLASLTSVYAEEFAPVLDSVYEKISGKNVEIDPATIEGKYVLSLFKDNATISAANVKHADVGIYDLKVAAAAGQTDYKFAIAGYKEYAITQKKINIDLATVSASLEIYKDAAKTQKIQAGNYIERAYGQDLIGEKVYIVWKNALNNGDDIELISNYMVFKASDMSVGEPKPIQLSSFSTENPNYVVGDIKTYEANIGKITPQAIELTLSSNIRKVNDGTNVVSYRGVDNSLEVKATYAGKTIKVTLPASNKIKYASTGVGIVEILPVSGSDTITSLFTIDTNNYTLTKVYGEIVYDETPPTVEYTVTGHSTFENDIYYSSSPVTITVKVSDDSGLDFTKYGDIDIFTDDGSGRVLKNVSIAQVGNKYEITFTATSSNIYCILAKDTLNEVIIPINIDINKDEITLEDEDLTVTRPEAESLVINGSQFELTIDVDTLVKNINSIELDINPKDGSGNVISDSIIGDYTCDFENNFVDNTSVITCLGKFKNNSIGYPTYEDGIRIFVNDYKITNYYGVANFVGLSAKVDADIDVDFHTVGINELSKVELYKEGSEVTSTTNIYGAFDKLVATFDLSMPLEDVEKPSAIINVLNDEYVIKNVNNVCEITEDNMQIICTIENIKFDTNRIYNIRLSGEIKYTTNSLPYTADVEYIADGSKIFEEGIIVDTKPLKATLEFDETEFRLEGATAKYRLVCNKDAIYVDCLNIDSSKIVVSHGSVLVNEDIIEWSGLKGIAAPTIKLAEGVVVDYAGNLSEESTTYKLDNSGISISKVEYTGTNGAVLNSDTKIGYGFTINVTMQFSKKVDLYGGVIYVDYRFGTGTTVTKEARFITSASTSSVKFDIVVGEGDSGQLFVTAVHNGEDGSVYDSTKFVAKRLEWATASPLSVDTDNANVSGVPTIVVDASLESFKHDGLYYLNKTNINKTSVLINFTEPLKKVHVVITIDNSGGDTIEREFTSISGTSVSIPLNNEYFKNDGRLQFSYVITMTDESGNVSVNEDLMSILTNIVLDRTAPVIELANPVLNINVNNLTPVEGTYTVNGGTYTVNEENVEYQSKTITNVVIVPASKTIGYKFTYGGNPIVKTIEIPAGVYKDYAGNNSAAVEVVLNITEDSYTLTPYIYVNGTYKEAIYYLDGQTFIYYVDKYTTFYFASNVNLTSNTPKFQYLNGYYTYTPDENIGLGAHNRFSLNIPTETFYAEGMANSSQTFEYKLIDTGTTVSANITTSADKTTLMAGDTITVTLTYTNPIIVSSAPSVRISIGGNEIVIANHNDLASDTSLVYVYEYVVGRYDQGALNFIGFDSPAVDILYRNVNINSDNNLGIVVDNAVFSATLELLEEGRTNSQAKFKVVCNKEENVNCYITDPSKVKIDGATVTIDPTTHIITATGLTSKKYEIIISAGAVIDDAGKESIATTYSLDNTRIYINNVKINKANDSNEYNNQFSTNSNFIVRVSLTAGTKRLSVTGIPTITYKIGTKTYTNIAGEVSGSELIFIISPNTNDTGDFEIISITTNAVDLDAYNNTTLFNATTDGGYIKKYDVTIDTINPSLVSAKVIVKEVTAAPDGKYYLNAQTLSKANLEVVFSEALHANSFVQVYISGYNSYVTSVANNVIGSKIVIPLNNIANLADGAFVMESISFTVIDLANNQVNGSSTSISYVNESNSSIQIVYDNTAPEIIGISLVEGSKTTIKPGDTVVYELTSADANLSSVKSRFSYKYDYTGNYNPIIPAGQVVDYAGNPSAVTKFEHIMIYVRDENPFIQITDITYLNSDANKVYYFGEAKPNVIKLVTSDDTILVCTLTMSGCYTVDDDKLLSINADGKLVIDPDIYEDDYGNTNKEVVTQYKVVDNSAAFARSIFDDTFNEENNVLFEDAYLVSTQVSKTYKLRFTSTREIKSVNYGDLRYDTSGNYYELTYRNDTFTSNATVIITDYCDSTITLMSIVFDNEAPIVRFDQAEYTFNSTQDIVLNYNVNDVNATRDLSEVCAITYGSCSADNANMKITITKSANPHELYVLTIPKGYYTDLVGNESAEVVVRIHIVSGPIFVPYVINPLTSAYEIPVSLSDGNSLTYYVKALDMTNVKFVTPVGVSYDGKLSSGTITNYLLYTGTWAASGNTVTIPAGEVSVNGINNVEQTFKFVVYDGPGGATISTNLTDMTENVYINTTHTISIIYTFDRDITIVNGAPKLNVKIGSENVAFDDVTVSGRNITYKYRPVAGQNGVLTIVGFEPFGTGKPTIYDNAYNALNDNNIALETKYIVDTTFVAEPTFAFTHNACIESASITTGNITYYCNSNSASTDVVSVAISDLEAGITNNLVMKINGVVYEGFNKNGVTEIPMAGREGAQKIVVSGKLIDTSGNETNVSYTVNNLIGVEGGYKVTMTLDPGNTIISQRTQMPKVTIKNNVGKYDKIMSDLTNPDMYSLVCEDKLCSEIAGLGDIVITATKSGNQVVLSLDGDIQDNFAGPNIATFNFLTMKSYYVVSSNEFRFDNTTPTIGNANITNGTYYNGKVYLMADGASILEFTVDFNLPLYTNPIVWLGLDKNNSIDVSSYATITQNNGVYTIHINNEGLTYVHNSNKFNKSDNEIVVSLGMTGENKVYAVETITAFSTFIDRSAPTVEFTNIKDNADHKIPVSSEYIDIKEALENDSGIASIIYKVCSKINTEDCVVVEPSEGYLDINHLDDGDKMLVVTVTDNVGNTADYNTNLFIDRSAPEIYLEKLHYDTDTLTATIAVIDRFSDINEELRYCVTNINTPCTEALSYRVELNSSGFVTISYNLKLDQNINYRNFKITVLPVSDEIGNKSPIVSEMDEGSFIVTRVEHDNEFDGATDGKHNYLVATNVAKDYRDILVGNNKGVDSYDIVLDEHLVVMNVIDIPENVSVTFGENSNVLTIKVSKNVKLADIMQMTVNARYIKDGDVNSSKITLSYPIKLTNLRVDTAPIVGEDIETKFATPEEGAVYSYIESSTIIDDEIRDERITSITPRVNECEASRNASATCTITYTVVENSGWSYVVDKVIDVSDAKALDINGVSNDKYVYNAVEYMVVYVEEELPTIEFVHEQAGKTQFVFVSMSATHGEITRNGNAFTLPLGRVTITYGYYNELEVLLLVSYNMMVVDLKVTNAAMDSEVYYKEHSIDLSKLFLDYETYGYVAHYEVEINGETFKFTNKVKKNYTNVYFQENSLVFANIYNGVYDITITGYLNDATNSNIIAAKLLDVKFDNGIYEDSEYRTEGFDVTDPEQSKDIIFTLTCDRANLEGCTYSTSNVDAQGNQVIPTYSQGVYTFVFTETENGSYDYTFMDDAGNTITVTREVTNLDTYAPSYNDSSYTGCLNINGVNYCKNPSVSIDAEDKVDPDHPNNTISGINSYQFGYRYGEETWLSSNVNNTSVVYEALQSGNIYTLFVRVHDKAGNYAEYVIVENVRLANSTITFNMDTLNVNTNSFSKPVVSSYITGDEASILRIVSLEMFINGTSYGDISKFADGKISYLELGIKEDIPNAQIHFVVTDELGNTLTSETFETNIDVTNPTIDLISYSDALFFDEDTGLYYISSGVVASQELAFMASEGIKSSSIIVENNGANLAKSIALTIKVYGANYSNAREESFAISTKILNIIVVVTDEAGNVSAEYAMTIIVDADNPYVDNNVTIENNIGGTITYNEPFYTNYNNVYEIVRNGDTTTFVITGQNVVAKLSAIKDNTSGIRKVCLFSGEELTNAAAMTCQNSNYVYLSPSGSTAIYMISDGSYVLYAIDNAGNEFTHKYVITNVSKGIEFKVNRSSSEITGGSVTLTTVIQSAVSSGSYTIKWYKQNDGGEFVDLNNKSMTYTATVNGTYRVCLTSSYSVTKCTNDMGGDVVINNINTSDIVVDGTYPVFAPDYSVLTHNGYFGDPTGKGTLAYLLPAITSTLSEISVSGSYVKNNNNISIPLPTRVYRADGVCENRPSDYCYDADTVRTYAIDIASLGLVNGDSITIEVVMNAANKTVGVYSERKTFTYISADNYTNASIKLSSSGSEDVPLTNGGYYQSIYAKLENVSVEYDAVQITKVELATFDNLVISKDNYVLVTKNGYYNSLSVIITDEFGNTKEINNITVTSIFTIDNVKDEIFVATNITNLPTSNDNKAYVQYTPYMKGVEQHIKIELMDAYHTHIIVYADNARQIIIQEVEAGSSYDFIYQAFYVEAYDKAGNISALSSEITHSTFEDIPFATYTYELHQPADGKASSITLVSNTTNVTDSNYSILGYVVCEIVEGTPNCPSNIDGTYVLETDITFVRPDVITDLSQFVGNYIKVYAKEHRGDEATYYLHGELDLRSVTITAPYISEDSGISYNGSIYSEIIYNQSQQIINLESNVKNIRYIVRDNTSSAGSDYPTINTSALFNAAWAATTGIGDFIARDTLDLGEYDSDKGLYVSTLTLNYLDGEYVFYILASDSDAAGNVIYSTVKVLRVTIDTKAPKVYSAGVEIDENMIYNANVTGTPSITFTAIEERLTNPVLRYMVDRGSLSSSLEQPAIVVTDDGSHTITVCDLDLSGNCLNTKVYNIKVDASSPEVSLRYGETAITTTATIGYTLTVGTRNIPTFETDIVIEDTSFDYVDVTVDAGTVGYKFRYDTTKGYLYRSGSRENLISIPVVNNLVSLVSAEGVLTEYSLHSVDVEQTTINIDNVEYQINRVGESITSITPITNYENSVCRIPLRVLITMALANNEFLIDVPYITGITLQAYDGMSQTNNSLTELTKDFDFFNPVISTVNGERIFTITNSTIRGYLSDSAYRFIYTSSTEGKSVGKATSMLSVCTTNASNYQTVCDGVENVLHLQAEKDPEDASNALLAVLKHILRFDGYEYNDSAFKDNRNRVYLYYTGSMDEGQPHTEGLVDDVGNLVLTQLTEVGRYNFYVQYSDVNNNTSYYYIPVIVEDTINPTFSLGTNDVTKSIDIDKQADGGEYAIYDFSSLTYTDIYYGTAGVTCEFVLTYASSPSHTFAVQNCEENMQFEHDGMVYANYDATTRKMSFNYSGTYTLTYTINDGGYSRNGINIKNTASKSYTFTVIDDTAPTITELVVDSAKGYTVSGNTIDLGVFEYKDIKATGISLAKAIKRLTISEPNQLYGTYNMSVFEYVATDSRLGTSQLASNDENKLATALSDSDNFRPQALGKYKLVYKVTNSNNLPAKITFNLQVVNTEVPKFTITDTYLAQGEKVSDYLNGNVYTANIEVTSLNNLLLTNLAEQRLSHISILVTDAFSGELHNGLIATSADKKCTVSDAGNKVGQYAASYSCVFKYTGTASDKLTVTVNVYLQDFTKPVIPTTNTTTYVKENKVTVTLPACSDNADTLYPTTSTCTIMYKVNGASTYTKYTSKITLTLVDGINTLEFYAIDRAGNTSNLYTHTYVLDRIAPVINIFAASEHVASDNEYMSWCSQAGSENCILNDSNNTYTLDETIKFVRFIVTDTNQDIVTLERFNGVGYTPISTTVISDYIDQNGNIVEGGVYRLTAKDKSLNTTVIEFYIYKEVVTESGNLTINVSQTVGGTTTTTDIEYREMFLIKYDDEKLTIPYSGNQAAFDSIKMSDGVHIVGLNGETFNYIRKYNGSDVYNLSTSIRLNDPAALENMIEINGETYLILLLVDNDDGNGNVTDPDGEGNNKGSSNSGASFAWVFYVLGAVGVVGGGFLVMKLRKKVKAA